MNDVIHLDWAMTTPLCNPARMAMCQAFNEVGVTASAHRQGLQARKTLTQARQKMASTLKVKPEEIIFTGSGTEAANLALLGTARALAQQGASKVLVLTAVEHPAVYFTAQALEQEGWRILIVPVDAQGFVDSTLWQEAMTQAPALCSIQAGSHDLGTLQPLDALLKSVPQKCVVHCDASAVAGWLELSTLCQRVNLLHLSAHRFGGPQGVGVLFRKQGISLQALTYGGSQEHGLRAGTENIPAIAGTAEALEWAQSTLHERVPKARTLADRLWKKLQSELTCVRLNGADLGEARLPHHLHITFEGIEAEALVLKLDLKGVLLSGPTGCVVRALKLPHTLKAVGMSPTDAQSSVMMGVDTELSFKDIDRAAEVIAQAVNQLRSMSLRWKQKQTLTSTPTS